MASEQVVVVEQKPVESMRVQAPERNAVGGKVIVFDGKSDKVDATKDDKKAETKPEEKAAEAKGADERLSDGLQALRKRLGFYKEEKPADKAEKTDDKKVEAKAEDKADDKKTDDEKPKVTKRPRSSVTPDLVEAVTQSAVRAATEATKIANESREKPKAAADDSETLSDADRRDLEVFKYLEKTNPTKYEGASKKFLKFTKEFDKYRTKWEEENQGKEFDPQAEDHDQFYAKHQPPHDPDDVEEARINMRVEAKLKEKDRESDDRYGKLETKIIEQELAPEIDKRAAGAVAAMVGEVDKDLAKVLAEKGPDAVAEADPIAFDVLDRSASDLRQALAELEKLSHPSGRFKFDDKNRIHGFLDSFATNLERSFKNLPLDEQVRDGKVFATQAEMRSMPKEQRSRYWAMGPEDIAAALVSETAAGAKKIIATERERIDKYLKARGLTATKTTDDEKAKEGKGNGSASSKPNSPAASTDANAAAGGKLGEAAVDPSIKTLVTKLFPA